MSIRWGLLVFAGTVACGGLLGFSDDDDPPSVPTGGDASSGDAGPSESAEGGSAPDDAGDAGADDAGRSTERRATCGLERCQVGQTCCVTASSSSCLVGEATCQGSELACTRRLDCAPGELCCVSGSASAAQLTAVCVAGTACPGGSNIMCSTSDDPQDNGCGGVTCSGTGKIVSEHGLRNDGDEPYGVCE